MANWIPTLLAVKKREGSKAPGHPGVSSRPAVFILSLLAPVSLILKWGTWTPPAGAPRALHPHGGAGLRRRRQVSPARDRAALAGKLGTARAPF